MSIKRSHIHEDGTVCYKSDSGISKIGIYEIFGKHFLVGYKQYTNHWYAYDEITGRETATFTADFFNAHIKRFKTSDLIDAPDCK